MPPSKRLFLRQDRKIAPPPRATEQRTAYFYRISDGQRVSGQTLLATRNPITIGVRSRDGFGRDIVVAADAFGVTCERNAPAPPVTLYSQEWTIKARSPTEARLEVRTLDGRILDDLLIVFADAIVPAAAPVPVGADAKAAVFAAVRSGRIVDPTSQLQAVEAHGFYSPDGRKKIVLAEAMFPVLASLARGGVVSILSLMRFGQPPHGRVVAQDTALCSAVDIGGFGGFTIDLTTPEGAATDPTKIASTIAGVAGVIDSLAGGVYAFGFTRPTPHDSGPPEPDNDVFLPKRPGEPDYKTWVGDASAQFVNSRAVVEVGGALSRRMDVHVDRMFQDGRDHLHLEVISVATGRPASQVRR